MIENWLANWFWSDGIFFGWNSTKHCGVLWFTAFWLLYEVAFFCVNRLEWQQLWAKVRALCKMEKRKEMLKHRCVLLLCGIVLPWVLRFNAVLGSSAALCNVSQMFLACSAAGELGLFLAVVGSRCYTGGREKFCSVVSKFGAGWAFLALLAAFLSGRLYMGSIVGVILNLVWELALWASILCHCNFRFELSDESTQKASNPYEPVREYELLFGARKNQADQLAEQLADPSRSGYSILVAGPWGSGKTSFVNGALEQLKNKKPNCRVIWVRTLELDSLEKVLSYTFGAMRTELKKRGAYVGLSSEYQKFVKAALESLTSKELSGLLTAGALSEPSDYRESRAALDKLLLQTMGEDKFIIVVDDIERCSREKAMQFLFFVREVATLSCCVSIFLVDWNHLEEKTDHEKESRFLEKFFNYTITLKNVSAEDIMAEKEQELNGKFLELQGLETPLEIYHQVIKAWGDEEEKLQQQLQSTRQPEERGKKQEEVDAIHARKQRLTELFQQPRTVVYFYERIAQYSLQFKQHCLVLENENRKQNEEMMQEIRVDRILWLIALVEVNRPWEMETLKKQGIFGCFSRKRPDETTDDVLFRQLFEHLTKSDLWTKQITYRLMQSEELLQELLWYPVSKKNYNLYQYRSQNDRTWGMLQNSEQSRELKLEELRAFLIELLSEQNLQDWQRKMELFWSRVAELDKQKKSDLMMPQLFFDVKIRRLWSTRRTWMQFVWEQYCLNTEGLCRMGEVQEDCSYAIMKYCIERLRSLDPVLQFLSTGTENWDWIADRRKEIFMVNENIEEQVERYLNVLVPFCEEFIAPINFTGHGFNDLKNYCDAVQKEMYKRNLLKYADIQEQLQQVGRDRQDVKNFERILKSFEKQQEDEIVFVPDLSRSAGIEEAVEHLKQTMKKGLDGNTEKETAQLCALMNEDKKFLTEQQIERLQEELTNSYLQKGNQKEWYRENCMNLRRQLLLCREQPKEAEMKTSK